MSQQTFIDLHAEPLTQEAQAARARSTDPETSHIAASAAVRFAGSHRGHIVMLLEHAGEAITTHEIADRSYLSHAQVHKRMAELKRLGYVVNGPDRPCNCERIDPKTCDGRLPMQTWKVP